MRELTVSLIIPAYNEEAHIGPCLESIENGDARILEIIVVDNNSSDKTCEIASTFSNVKVINESLKGVMSARDKGYRESRGDIVVFLDADCRVPKGWIADIIHEFERNPRLACYTGPYKYYDLKGWQNLLAGIYWNFIVYLAYFIVGYVGNFGNLALRRSVLVKMNGLDTTIAFYGDDTDTARRAKKYGKVLYSSSHYVYSSGRRFAKEGLIKTTWIYALNFLSEVLFHRPYTLSRPNS